MEPALSSRARELQVIRDAVLGGQSPPQHPRALVARSWARVMSLGLDPDGANLRDPLSLADLEGRRRSSALHLVIDDLRAVLTSVADASQFLMVVCDAEGVILWRDGSARVRREADRLGFADGVRWTEQVVGTNAIGTALAEASPVQLFSAEHFEQRQHGWYCTAAPIHDPRTGDLLGVVDVSGPALTMHPALVALVDSAVVIAESRLRQRHEARIERLRRSAEPVVAGLRGPLLVVDDDGWVAHRSGISVRDRIGAPEPQRTVAVPGLGICLPERLPGGWLIRPPGAARGRVVATLDLCGDGPALEASIDGEPWRTPLTRRHAEIMAALATAGPAGCSAAELSQILYGDAEHLVTVRAEVSRLRRVVGALIATGGYRLADGVELTVHGP